MNTNSNEKNGFYSLSPGEYTGLAFSIALILAESVNDKERAILGNFFLAIGENLTNLTPGAWEI